MTIKLKNDKVDLPNGTYRGSWSAYTIYIASHERELTTEDGCRSLDGIPVTVEVIDGRAVAS